MTFVVSIAFSATLFPLTVAAYDDVVPQSLFYDAVTYFSYNYPILDTSKQDFRPLHQVIKAEFLKLIYEGSGYSPDLNQHASIPFHDLTGDEWFAPYVQKALEDGLIVYSEQEPNFNATETYTQLEALKMIFYVFNLECSFSQTIRLDILMRIKSLPELKLLIYCTNYIRKPGCCIRLIPEEVIPT